MNRAVQVPRGKTEKARHLVILDCEGLRAHDSVTSEEHYFRRSRMPLCGGDSGAETWKVMREPWEAVGGERSGQTAQR